jgi:very-short-patch-repair endonuclease
VLVQPIKAVKRARQLRQEMSLPEVLLWVELQKRPGGHKFRKQVPQHPYTLDFACLKARLAIEVDGEGHDRGDQPKKDQVRDAVLQERGFRTLRIPAYEVLHNMEGCIIGIVAACGEVGPLRHALTRVPPPRSGEDLL